MEEADTSAVLTEEVTVVVPESSSPVERMVDRTAVRMVEDRMEAAADSTAVHTVEADRTEAEVPHRAVVGHRVHLEDLSAERAAVAEHPERPGAAPVDRRVAVLRMIF